MIGFHSNLVWPRGNASLVLSLLSHPHSTHRKERGRKGKPQHPLVHSCWLMGQPGSADLKGEKTAVRGRREDGSSVGNGRAREVGRQWYQLGFD